MTIRDLAAINLLDGRQKALRIKLNALVPTVTAKYDCQICNAAADIQSGRPNQTRDPSEVTLIER